MADGLNRATLIGNLGSTPELRFTQGNRAVLKMRIATTESYLDDKGVKKEITQWHNVLVWGKRAEGLAKILDKGDRLYAEGRIQNRTYDDKDNVKRSISEIVVSNIILLGGRRADNASRGPASASEKSSGEHPPDDAFQDAQSGDDDIPF